MTNGGNEHFSTAVEAYRAEETSGLPEAGKDRRRKKKPNWLNGSRETVLTDEVIFIDFLLRVFGSCLVSTVIA